MNDDVTRNTEPGGAEPPEQPAMSQPGSQAVPPPPGGYRVPYGPQYSPLRSRWLLPAAFVVGCLPWLIIGLVILAALSFGGRGGESGPHIALIRITGVITAGKSGAGLFGGSTSGSESVIEQLEKARRNSDAKAIVLRINSPGGSPAGSEEVYNEIRRITRAGKPVYVSMADVAASGGYYIASAADTIYADASTLTGSIGVIWDVTDTSGLLKKIGVNPQVVKSGKFKDIGSPDRPMTGEERKLLEGIVMDTYGQFVRAVAKGRNLPEPRVREIADGRVFTGSQALKLKLVDEIGGLRETVRAAASAAGISRKYKTIEYKRKSFWSEFFGCDGDDSSQAEEAVYRELLRRLVGRDGDGSGLR